jgi:hypothetical protein
MRRRDAAVRPSVGAKLSISGKAVVCCVHDRQKQQVATEEQVVLLGLTQGIIYNRRQHKIHKCACCQNLFVDPSDEPRFCTPCKPKPLHALGGPLPDPIGVVDA